jgi:hypothetical protein
LVPPPEGEAAAGFSAVSVQDLLDSNGDLEDEVDQAEASREHMDEDSLLSFASEFDSDMSVEAEESEGEVNFMMGGAGGEEDLRVTSFLARPTPPVEDEFTTVSMAVGAPTADREVEDEGMGGLEAPVSPPPSARIPGTPGIRVELEARRLIHSMKESSEDYRVLRKGFVCQACILPGRVIRRHGAHWNHCRVQPPQAVHSAYCAAGHP